MGDFSSNKHIKIYEIKQYPYSIHRWRIIAEFHPIEDGNSYLPNFRLSVKDNGFGGFGGFYKNIIRYRAEYLTGDAVYFPKWNDAQIEVSTGLFAFQYDKDKNKLQEEIKQYCYDVNNYLYKLKNSRYYEEVSWQGVSNV